MLGRARGLLVRRPLQPGNAKIDRFTPLPRLPLLEAKDGKTLVPATAAVVGFLAVLVEGVVAEDGLAIAVPSVALRGSESVDLPPLVVADLLRLGTTSVWFVLVSEIALHKPVRRIPLTHILTYKGVDHYSCGVSYTGVDGNRTHQAPRIRRLNGFEGRGTHQVSVHSLGGLRRRTVPRLAYLSTASGLDYPRASPRAGVPPRRFITLPFRSWASTRVQWGKADVSRRSAGLVSVGRS